MVASACHQDEIETAGQSGLEGLDDHRRVSHCFCCYAGGSCVFFLLSHGKGEQCRDRLADYRMCVCVV